MLSTRCWFKIRFCLVFPLKINLCYFWMLDSKKTWRMMWILGLFLLKGLSPLSSALPTWRPLRSQRAGQTTAVLPQQTNSAIPKKWQPSHGRWTVRWTERWSQTSLPSYKWHFRAKFKGISPSLEFSLGLRGNEGSSLYQPGGGRLQQDSDTSGALWSCHRFELKLKLISLILMWLILSWVQTVTWSKNQAI